jgi:hypothetical protein
VADYSPWVECCPAISWFYIFPRDDRGAHDAPHTPRSINAPGRKQPVASMGIRPCDSSMRPADQRASVRFRIDRYDSIPSGPCDLVRVDREQNLIAHLGSGPSDDPGMTIVVLKGRSHEPTAPVVTLPLLMVRRRPCATSNHQAKCHLIFRDAHIRTRRRGSLRGKQHP